jgi:HEAT repeat protein
MFVTLSRPATLALVILAGQPSFLGAAAAASASEDARIQQLLTTLERDPGFKVRLRAAVLLGRSKDPRAPRALMAALRDEHDTIRAAACLGLANLGAVEATSALIFVAATDEEANVRKDATTALQRFDKEALWPHLLQASNSNDLEVRRQAIGIIAEWQDDRARLRLVEALGDDERIVQIVENTLSSLGPNAKAELLRLGLDSPKPTVRLKAAEMLGSLASDKAVTILMEAYEQELESDDLRKAIRDQLRRLKEKLPVAQLLKEASRGEERFARARALKFLGVIGGDRAIGILLEALRDEDIYVRGVAALALAEAGDPKAIPELVRLVAEQDNARIVQIVRNSIQILERKQKPKP